MRRLLTLLFCLLPALSLAADNPKVRLKTSKGDIVIELDAKNAPISTANFLSYVEKDFYDGTVFHRIIDGFMIQGGGFGIEDGSLTEKPTDPPIHNEGQNGLKNLRGTIAMARTNELHSATSQFFINVVNNDGLDYPNYGGYAVFGKVVEGMDVVDAIRKVPTGVGVLVGRDPSGQTFTNRAPNVPLEPVVIEWAKVEEAPVESIGNSKVSGKTAATKDLSNENDLLDLSSCCSAWAYPHSWIIMAFAFLLGSIPFGLLIAKSQGINIREHGSGNIGATNVWRTMGKKFGIPCLILDALKGLIPVLLAVSLFRIEGRQVMLAIPMQESWVISVHEEFATSVQTLHILVALLAVLGHNYSPWVGFKGGKGIATSAGVLLGLMPVGFGLLLAVWLLLFLTTRYVSVASIGASCALPLLTLYGSWHHGRLQDGTWNKPLFIFALVIAVMATWKHRSNIKRLMQGTENRFTRKSKSDHA